MNSELFFAIKTIGLSTRMKRKPQTLLQADRHNLREDQKERGSRGHIEPTRSHLNQRIAGPALSADVVALALARMIEAGHKPLRHDYTQAYELLFSLPAGTTIDTTLYFAKCLKWAVSQFALDNILSADEHHDEAAPHLHILVLPMNGAHYLGSKLIDRARLANLRDSFAELALTFGLKEPARRLHGAHKEAAARMVLTHLQTTQDAILKSALWATCKQDIERNPARYVAALGLVLTEQAAPVQKGKTMNQIFTSAGKGPKVERVVKPIGFGSGSLSTLDTDVVKPIGFENGPKNIETIPVLVSAPKPSVPSFTLPARLMPPPEQIECEAAPLDAVRLRDDHNDPAQYDLNTGDYFRPPQTKARYQRQAADAWVTQRLPGFGRAWASNTESAPHD